MSSSYRIPEEADDHHQDARDARQARQVVAQSWRASTVSYRISHLPYSEVEAAEPIHSYVAEEAEQQRDIVKEMEEQCIDIDEVPIHTVLSRLPYLSSCVRASAAQRRMRRWRSVATTTKTRSL